MEGTKENWFEVRYNTKLDRLVIKKERKISKFIRLIKKHRFFTTVSIAFIMFSTLNVILITSFMRILQNL